MYNYELTYGALGAGLAFAGVLLLFVYLISTAIAIFTIVCQWKVYKKAGREGWAAIVPVYTTIVALQIAELPLWYIVLLLIPFANIYVLFKLNIEMAHKFGKSTGFGIGLVFFNPIFTAILAFSKDAKYIGESTQN